MQCTRTTARSVCAAHNAFDLSLALRTAFGTASISRQQMRGEFTYRPQIAVRKVGNETEQLDDVTFLKRAVDEMGRQRRAQWDRGDLLSQHDWSAHTQLVKELGARLAHDEGRAALNKLTERQQQMITKGMDYTPKVIVPRTSEVAPVASPWAMPKSRRSGIRRGRTVLDWEIRSFASYMELSPMERVARQVVAEEIVSFVNKATNSRTGVEVFGSTVTGLETPLSDIDVRVWDTVDGNRDPRKMSNRMIHIRNRLIKSERFGFVFLRHGRHPIINCQHMDSGIQIQIVAGNGASPQHEVVAKYIESIPNARLLYPVIRTFFEMRGLSDVHSGGVGSYAQFVMLVAAIVRESPFQGVKPPSPANHLLRFLGVYANLDTSQRGVFVSARTWFKKHRPHPTLKIFAQAATRRGDSVRAGQWAICARSEYEPCLLCIQDPANPTNDLGRRSSATKHITLTIQNVYFYLRAILNDPKRFKEDESVLELIVGRCHEVYQARRRQMEDFGIKKMKEREESEKEAEEFKLSRTEADNAEVEHETRFEQMDSGEEGGGPESEQSVIAQDGESEPQQKMAQEKGSSEPEPEKTSVAQDRGGTELQRDHARRRVPIPSFNAP